MISCFRTTAVHPDFQQLVRALDAELRVRDGKEHSFYAQFNKTDAIRFVVVAFENDVAAGCGAIKEYAPDTMEVKRMYVPPQLRGRGIASTVLAELEKWTAELGYRKCIL